jgi:hypothetical protein
MLQLVLLDYFPLSGK